MLGRQAFQPFLVGWPIFRCELLVSGSASPIFFKKKIGFSSDRPKLGFRKVQKSKNLKPVQNFDFNLFAFCWNVNPIFHGPRQCLKKSYLAALHVFSGGWMTSRRSQSHTQDPKKDGWNGIICHRVILLYRFPEIRVISWVCPIFKAMPFSFKQPPNSWKKHRNLFGAVPSQAYGAS